jgi:hypothetical protein
MQKPVAGFFNIRRPSNRPAQIADSEFSRFAQEHVSQIASRGKRSDLYFVGRFLRKPLRAFRNAR